MANKYQSWQLIQKQSLTLEQKIKLTEKRIKEWYEYWDGDVWVSFSGGKDSTVMLDIVRSLYPGVKALFVDTGLEYPEIRKFVKTISNVEWLKPKMNFKEVIETYGYPVITKEQAQFIRELKHSNSDNLKNTRLNGNKWGMGAVSKRYLYLLDAPFEISEKCCDVMKKRPLISYIKQSRSYPFIGELAVESKMRILSFYKYGCNAFDLNIPKSRPLMIWTEQDVLEYLVTRKIKYCQIYGCIEKNKDSYYLTGAERTGCMFCGFGIHLESEPNRFQLMKYSHPKQYLYCLDVLGFRKVFDYMGVPY